MCQICRAKPTEVCLDANLGSVYRELISIFRYGGVFWVDLTSPAAAASSYARVARLAGLLPNVSQAMHWLSSLEVPWLLIMDNVDSNAQLQEYFPRGSKGHVLISTRHSDHKIHGNVGCRFFNFQGTDLLDSVELLLRAAAIPEPWGEPVLAAGEEIAQVLGCLPLALVQAGRSISTGLATLDTYLAMYERFRARMYKQHSRSSPNLGLHLDLFNTFEMNLARISQTGTREAEDAIELLRIFSFFHNENIHFEILARCLRNLRLEEQIRKEDMNMPSQKEPWTRSKISDVISGGLQMIYRSRPTPVLPAIIRDAERATRFNGDFLDSELRLRHALHVLVRGSFITRNDVAGSESYIMHRLLHTFVREESMNMGEQAVWSEAAATTLSYSLLWPNHYSRSEHDEEAYHNVILPHIEHVQTYQTVINDAFDRQQTQRKWRVIPSMPHSLDPIRAVTLLKFSLTYSYCGNSLKAYQIQAQLQDYFSRMMGAEDLRMCVFMLYHAGLLLDLDRLVEAKDLQMRVIKIYKTSLVPDQSQLLRAKSALAQTLATEGAYDEAVELQAEVLSGFRQLHGPSHQHSLEALNTLAIILAQSYDTSDLATAEQYHSEALLGMQQILGNAHSQVLFVQKCYAMSLVKMDKSLEQALVLAERVHVEWKRRFGDEHHSTQSALLTKASVQRASGMLNEAETLLRHSIGILARTLGEHHDMTLTGSCELAHVLRQKAKLQEAESILVNSIKGYRKTLPDKAKRYSVLSAMSELSECYKAQSRHEKYLGTVQEAAEEFGPPNVSAEHPLVRKMRAELER